MAEAQALAAAAFGSREARFLVGGATAGVLAMVLATVGPGQTLLAPLPFHRSVAAAAVLSGCELRAVPPRLADPAGVPVPPATETLRRAVAGLRPAAVLATSPSYQGVAADLAGWAAVCRDAGIPLLVDAAHGAHFGFADDLPAPVMASGASAAVISLHKTAGALTPGAVLLVGPAPVDVSRFEAALRLVETSSPPFPVLASLDLARRRLALTGRRDWTMAAELSARTSARVVEAAGGWLETLALPAGLERDPTRLAFVLTAQAPPALTGISLARAVARSGVDLELAGWADVVAVATPADTQGSHDRLVTALTEALRGARRQARGPEAGRGGRPDEPAESDGPDEPAELSGPAKRELALSMEKDCWRAERVYVMTPSEAFRRPHRRVPVAEAAGRVAADVISPYPPGVPLVLPGQRIEEAVVRYLAFLGRHHRRVHGLVDGHVPDSTSPAGSPALLVEVVA